MDDPVHFELCYADARNNDRGYLERAAYEQLVKAWLNRPQGPSRYIIEGFRIQQGKPPLGTIRVELDSIHKIKELNLRGSKPRMSMSEMQRNRRSGK